MTTGTIKTQGTELYFVDNTETDPVLRKMLCPTGLTGIGGGAPSTIPTTCLDTVGDEEAVPGLRQPVAVSAPFNFIPTSGAQQALFDLKTSGNVTQWIALFSDGTVAPTLDTDGAIVPPAGNLRSSVSFNAAVSEVAIDVATNEIVRGTLNLLRSGAETYTFPDATV